MRIPKSRSREDRPNKLRQLPSRMMVSMVAWALLRWSNGKPSYVDTELGVPLLTRCLSGMPRAFWIV